MKRKILATHAMIRNTLFVLLVVIVALFVYLKNGISINHLKLGSFTIEKLYLKLNKKLILRADKLIIPTNRKKQPIPNPEEYVDQVNEMLQYFETIELKEINFKNDHYSVLYTDNVFYMVNDLFEVATHQISRVGDELHAVMDLFYLKQYGIRLSGKLVYDFKKDTALLRGQAEYRDIFVDFMVKKKKSDIYYTMKSKDFSQLKPLIEQFKIPPKISIWITDRVKAESYRLKSVKGRAHIDKKGFKPMIDTIKAEALLTNAVIDFKDGIDPVEAEQMGVIFENSNLYFKPLRLHFKERTLTGSSGSIVGLSNPKTAILKLDLKVNTALDEQVHKILEAYAIKIPLFQKSGTIDAKLQIDVQLKAKKVAFSGDFKVGKGEVALGNVVLPVLKGEVHVDKSVAVLSGFELENEMYKSALEGEVDFKKKTAALDLDISYFYLGTKGDHFLSLKNTKVPLVANFQHDVLITLPTLKTDITIVKSDGSKTIEMTDLRVLKRSLRELPISINGGYLKVVTQNALTYQFNGMLTRNDCFLYENESTCLTQIPIAGSFSQENFTIKAFQDRFIFDSKKSLVSLKNLNFDLKKFFDTHEKNNKSGIKKKMKVVGTNSILRYNKSKLLTNRYTLGILPNGNFHFKGVLGNDVATVTQKKEYMEIKADRISDKMLHPLINFSGLQNGRYSVSMKGEAGKLMKGVITLDGGVMSDFKAYNNVLALINTLPALATFKSPGFSRKGFRIKHGLIKFTIVKGRTLTFDSILIEGKSATISGDGVVDLETQEIDVDLAIQTAKSVGKLVGSLPVVGYILAGDNKSVMTVGLHISGTLEKPNARTTAVKDILLLPFNMLKRTFDSRKGAGTSVPFLRD